jgi:hypothetical protein
MPPAESPDPLAYLDFDEPASSGDTDSPQRDALDFDYSAADGDGDGEPETDIDPLDAFAPTEVDDTGTEAAAIDSQVESADDEAVKDDDEIELFTVSNPAESVSVSALIDGRTQRIHLAGKATAFTETDLVDEILVLAELARQKGLAGQFTFLSENPDVRDAFRQLGDEYGLDGEETFHELLELDMALPTPEQAEVAQAEEFARRYADS